jgi:hypothetical protein
MNTIPRLTTSLAEWLATARPGERVIVQTAQHNANRDVMDARSAGHITTAQRRVPGTHSFDLIAFKLKRPAPADVAPLGRGSIGQPLPPRPVKEKAR